MPKVELTTFDPKTLETWTNGVRLDYGQFFSPPPEPCWERKTNCPFLTEKIPLCGKCGIAESDHKQVTSFWSRRGFRGIRTEQTENQETIMTTAHLHMKGIPEGQVSIFHASDQDGAITFIYKPAIDSPKL